MSETITDPLGTGWWNTFQGNGEEVGDNCATYGTPSNPLAGISQFAYAPTLGGTASAGNLFDQVINAHKYYNQTEWSNGDINCKAKNTASSLVAKFTASGSLRAGSTISFTPTGSSSGHGYSSTSWSFGDGKSSFSRAAPVKVTHVFAKAGTYRVVLTLVDTLGNLKWVATTLTIAA
jgi:PKD repeat protein